MSEEKHIIEPQRLGIWVAAAFILALLALVLSLINLKRTGEGLLISQTEILLLNNKIEALQKNAAMPAAPAMQEKAAKPQN
ncbi:hypothetical protein SAMN05660284_00809 [Formivibrio citricus]|uniref:Uncharacterized protein n=1 Tax=Formivibrio citricus TaxID=83765 RepID=A0A1I4WYM1_9NEIS|nr:hypothetical protein [Formivibrio citricus]SFN18844.1 hypothetical protein SAMN05660284_00809 [Formivibrio citricus]